MRLIEIKNPKYKVFLDLDGVMADFKRGVKEILKLPADAPSSEIFKALGQNSAEFFSKLPKTKDADRLWVFLKGNDLQILTGVPRTDREKAVKEKIQWVRKNLSKNVKVITSSSKGKRKFSGPNHILIDDRKDNIQDWITAGGIGILHTSTAKTIKELKKLGFK